MFSIFTKIALVIAIAIAYHVKYHRKPNNEEPNKSFTSLIIGILSARENFQHRESIRNTWLNKQNPGDFKSWFIVGNKSCSVPPHCRRKKYDCERWQLNFSAVQPNFHTCEIAYHECSNSRKVFHQGFSFQVNHDVVVTKLGLYSKLIPPGGNLFVSLLDLQTKAVVVNASLYIKNLNANYSGYIYKEVEHFLLPKNYEGLILVEGALHQSACGIPKWNTNGGVITISRVFISSDDVESIAFSEEIRVAPSVAFQVQDLPDLKKIAESCTNVSSDWNKYNEKVNEKLFEENEKWSDILLLDVLDTYRNLPKKLLLFYNWLSKNYQFDFLLKTDDDCIIDINRILLQLQNKKQFNPGLMWIWSRFRSSWPVNYVGKWADYDYKSPVYPIFPCGGAYILSQRTVEWIQQNTNFLFSYQGEDVSLGIWLSAINPSYIEDKRWECDNECSQNSFNRAQLSLQEMYQVWSMKENCGNICHCEIPNV